MLQSPPPYVPFVEYVLKVLEQPPHMYVAKLTACCTMLFLTREDPDLLRELCLKWAVRFQQDRVHLIRYIQRRASYFVGPPEDFSTARQGGTEHLQNADHDGTGGEACGAAVEEYNGTVAAQFSWCDSEKAVEHLLSILNTLVPIYFSCNWHRADYVIQINKEYEAFVRQYVLPVCIELTPEDGVDDEEHTPWLLPPHTYLEPSQSVSSFYTPTSTVAPYARIPSPSFVNDSSNSAGIDAGHTEEAAAASASMTSIKSPAANAPEERSFSFGFPLHDAGAPGRKEECLTAFKGAQLVGDDDPLPIKTSTNGPARELISVLPAVRVQSGSHAPSLNRLPIVSPNTRAARAFYTAAVEGLRFLTLSTYREALLRNTKGLVTVFHAKYSPKSNEAIEMFQTITLKRLLDPMPTIAIVYAVAEPELSSLYEIGWFPTIIYTPPLRYQTGKAHPLAVSQPNAMAQTDDCAEHAKGSTSLGSEVVALASPFSGTVEDGTAVAQEGKGLSNSIADMPCAPISGSTRSVSAPTARDKALASIPALLPCGDDVTEHRSGSVSIAHGENPSPSDFTGSCAVRSASDIFSETADGAGELLYGEHLSSACSSEEMSSCSAASASGRNSNPDLTNSSFDRSGEEHATQSSPDSVHAEWALLQSDDHVVYPWDGVLTIPALVEWISARGASVPRRRKVKGFFTRIKSIRQEEKFKRFRAVHSAVVMLRRLQGESNTTDNCNDTVSCFGADTPSAAPHAPEPPLFVFLGGGMAAGKTTAVAALAASNWWKSHKRHSVIVNADEFKLPLDGEMESPEAHMHSTRAAEKLLVKALNQGRSIVLDGTMMWKPFVQQVVAMVRAAHVTLFRQGPGYNRRLNTEQYFLVDKAREPAMPLPYDIIFLGITVEVETAVPRGFLRKFQTNRGVPISNQLRSFRLFAENFADYVAMVDRTTLYNNNVFVDLEKGELPPVLAECSPSTDNKLVVHDDAAFQQFLRQQQINDNADNVSEVYPYTPVSQ